MAHEPLGESQDLFRESIKSAIFLRTPKHECAKEIVGKASAALV
jgi:hypothetical protein